MWTSKYHKGRTVNRGRKKQGSLHTIPAEDAEPRLAISTLQSPGSAPARPILFKFDLRTVYKSVLNKVAQKELQNLGAAIEITGGT